MCLLFSLCPHLCKSWSGDPGSITFTFEDVHLNWLIRFLPHSLSGRLHDFAAIGPRDCRAIYTSSLLCNTATPAIPVECFPLNFSVTSYQNTTIWFDPRFSKLKRSVGISLTFYYFHFLQLQKKLDCVFWYYLQFDFFFSRFGKSLIASKNLAQTEPFHCRKWFSKAKNPWERQRRNLCQFSCRPTNVCNLSKKKLRLRCFSNIFPTVLQSTSV